LPEAPTPEKDVILKAEVARVFAENFAVYDVRKVWRQMMREGFPIARCTVVRLMREMGGAAQGSGDAKHRWNGCGGLAGMIRGKPVRTTISDKAASCPRDHVNRQFHALAPNRLRVSDFTRPSPGQALCRDLDGVRLRRLRH